MEGLPYIDEHVISVDANRADTWSALLMLWCKDRDEPRDAPAVRAPFFSLDETVPMQRLLNRIAADARARGARA
jgi:hypothetical protein